MKLRWTHPALADLDEAQTFIAQENPVAAQAVAQRVWVMAQSLQTHPAMGRAGHLSGTRELVVAQTPYLIVYRIRQNCVEILRLWHGRQNWKAAN